MSDGETLFFTADVAKHNTDKDCWIIIENNVYDVTGFISDHPGGSDILIQMGGKDATNDFQSVGHSEGKLITF